MIPTADPATTAYIKILQNEDAAKLFHLVDWHEWRNVKNLDDHDGLSRLALNKWLRERGGSAPGERLTVNVYGYDSFTPHNPRGGPSECWLIQFEVSSKRSADA